MTRRPQVSPTPVYTQRIVRNRTDHCARLTLQAHVVITKPFLALPLHPHWHETGHHEEGSRRHSGGHSKQPGAVESYLNSPHGIGECNIAARNLVPNSIPYFHVYNTWEDTVFTTHCGATPVDLLLYTHHHYHHRQLSTGFEASLCSTHHFTDIHLGASGQNGSPATSSHADISTMMNKVCTRHGLLQTKTLSDLNSQLSLKCTPR